MPANTVRNILELKTEMQNELTQVLLTSGMQILVGPRGKQLYSISLQSLQNLFPVPVWESEETTPLHQPHYQCLDGK